MKKTSIILTTFGIVLLFFPFFCGDILDEQTFRWGLEHWMFAGAFVCYAVAMILGAIRTKKIAWRIVLAVLSLLPLLCVVETVLTRPRLIYSDNHYQMWAKSFDKDIHLNLYYGTGLVMTDAGGTTRWGKLDSSRVVLHDDLGVIWIETWTSYRGKPYEHEGNLVPINSRFSKGNYEMHTAELDSLLASYRHDTVWPHLWYKHISLD